MAVNSSANSVHFYPFLPFLLCPPLPSQQVPRERDYLQGVMPLQSLLVAVIRQKVIREEQRNELGEVDEGASPYLVDATVGEVKVIDPPQTLELLVVDDANVVVLQQPTCASKHRTVEIAAGLP